MKIVSFGLSHVPLQDYEEFVHPVMSEKRKNWSILLFVLFSNCGFTPQKYEKLRTVESLIFCFLWPQVTWCKVTLIQLLLMHRTMTFYATDQPHQGMDLQYVANLLFPVTLSLLIFQHSSLPLPLILPSGRRIRVMWGDLDIMLFPCVITVSHQWLVISHVATLSPSADFVSPHPVKATLFFKNPSWILISETRLSMMRHWSQVKFISAALRWCHHVDWRRRGSPLCYYFTITYWYF